MSEEKKNITARDLLSRLGKGKASAESENDVKKLPVQDTADTSSAAEAEAQAEQEQIIAEAEHAPDTEDSEFIRADEIDNIEIEEDVLPDPENVFTDIPEFVGEDEKAGGILGGDISLDDFPSYDFPEPGFADGAIFADEPELPDVGEPEFFEPGNDAEDGGEDIPDISFDFEEEPAEDDGGEIVDEYDYSSMTEEFPDEYPEADTEEQPVGEDAVNEYPEGEEDIPDLTEEEALAFEEAAGLAAGYEGENYGEYADDAEFSDELDEDFAGENVNEYVDAASEDIIPDDDFFDDDPLEDEIPEEGDGEYEDGEEYSDEEPDREEEFKNLVEEVTGDNYDSELTENDISLMVALGMEDELAKTVGEETATQMTEDYVADQEEWVDRTGRYGPDEYSDPSENVEIAEAYKKRNKFAIIRLICTAVLAIALLIIENLPVLGYQLSGALDPAVYPVVYIMIDLQIALLGAAMVWKNVKNGLSGLLKFKVTVDTIPALITVASIVAAVVSASTTVPGVEPPVFNFPAALCYLLTAVNEYLTVRREIFSFNIISSKKRKFVMRNLSTRDAVLESEAVADLELDSAVADEGDIIKIQETDFVDGYFWRTKNRSTANDSYVGLAVIISLALAVIVAIYAGISKQTQAVSAGYATFVAALPLSMLLIGAYPFFIANRNAYEHDSTIIGEGSVEEYSGVGVLSFDDVNVFRSQNVKVQNVRLFNNSRIDKVLYYAASVFSATGGPLADVFCGATMEIGHSNNVQVLETGTGYIEATVNGKSIMFGRAAALAKQGIIIPDNVISDTTDIPADCSVMYMIYQGKLVSKMVVNYVIEPDFEYVLKELTGSGMCVCVKTFDPNIDEEMIYRQLTSSAQYSMRVIKYKSTDEISKYARRAEGGIVSRGNTKALLHTVSSCDKILSAQKTGYIIGVLSAIFGAAVVGVMLISGSFSSLYSLYIVLCQLLWLIPAAITARLIVK